jgi:hypothetical protein
MHLLSHWDTRKGTSGISVTGTTPYALQDLSAISTVRPGIVRRSDADTTALPNIVA